MARLQGYTSSPSLQKSCLGCAKAKRKCDRLCPCSRCQAEGEVCRYRNLPWVDQATREAVDEARTKRASRLRDTKLARCSNDVFREGSIRAVAPCRTIQPSGLPMVWRPDAEDLKIIGVLLQDIPSACIYRPAPSAGSTPSLSPLIYLLQETQSVLSTQIATIFHFNQKQQQLLMHLSHRLWLEAPTSLPRIMSPRNSWLLAESIRRTIIAAHVLSTTMQLLTTGIVQYSPFLASLPFDSRVAMWDMQDDEPWLAYMDVHGAPLVSMREWMDGDETGNVRAGSALQRLALRLWRPWSVRKSIPYE